jgi:hypothetical protein
MRTLHQTLHLQHHRHTGKVLHHRHTSYRGLAVVLVLAGLVVAGVGAANRAAADSFGVSAWANIPVPSTAPIISVPQAGATVTGGSVLVTGTCPLVTPQAVISISVDGAAAGTGACDSNNDFSVPVSLSGGSHEIVAGSMTISGQKGPGGSPIHVTSHTTGMPSTISIEGDQPFAYADGRSVTWTGTIGTSGNEYVHLDWGDNSQSNYTVQAGAQQFTHRYSSGGSHNVLLAVADNAGQSSAIQFASAAFTAYVPTKPVATPLYQSRTVAGLYGLYLTVVAVTGIVWLEAKHAARQTAIATP